MGLELRVAVNISSPDEGAGNSVLWRATNALNYFSRTKQFHNCFLFVCLFFLSWALTQGLVFAR